MARYSGWGALPGVFEADHRSLARHGAALEELLDSTELDAARRSTLNAHYTSPDIAAAIWSAAAEAGFEGGRVLEPGCGTGVFMATAPEAAHITGVELDPTTAQICELLHPGQRVVNESFADFYQSEFDLVIGNVPFCEIGPHDPIYNRGRNLDNLHNYFIRKSLHLLRPGGLLMVVTSRYTLDAQDPSGRARIASVGRFLGSVRLPNSAFDRHAGTKVVTDVVMLQRRSLKASEIDKLRISLTRDPTDARELDAWCKPTMLQARGGRASFNEWYEANPDLILGDVVVERYGMYGQPEPTVESDLGPEALADQLRIRLTDTILAAKPAALPPARADAASVARTQAPAAPHDAARPWLKQGSIIEDASTASGFAQIIGHETVPYACPKNRSDQLRRLIAVRDQLLTLLAAEADPATTDDELAPMRRALNGAYARYVRNHGALNEGRIVTDDETAARRSQLALARFTNDPDYPTLLALEDYDPDTGDIAKADIFDRRVVRAVPEARLETLSDCVASSLRPDYTLDLQRLEDAAAGAGIEVPDLAEAGLAYRDPLAAGAWTPAAHYLSGNVALKLEAAAEAAKDDDGYAANVAALRDAMPKQATTDEVHLRLGASWVPASEMEAFARHMLQHSIDSVSVAYTDTDGWVVEYHGLDAGAAASLGWSTADKYAHTIFADVLAGKYVKVTERDADGNTVINLDATEQVQEKIEEWHAEFRRWAFEDDPDRATRILDAYNSRFRCYVKLQPDTAWVSQDRLRAGIVLRDHQLDAAARIVHGSDMLLGHAVGAGKTITIALGLLEMRRLGQINKPAVIVPNHLTAQFGAEVAWAFPNARVLIRHPGSPTKAQRKEFMMKCATGDWDLVVVPYSFFEQLRQPAIIEQMHYEEELDEIMAAMTSVAANTGSGSAIKRLEKAKERARTLAAKAKEAINERTDPTYDFAALGIDYIAVDEGHNFKNLSVHSAHEKLRFEGSPRATKLAACLRTLRHLYPERKSHATIATGTPVANRVSELWAMQRYVQPDVMREAGVYRFDSWAANFGKVVTNVEYHAARHCYVPTTRFAQYVNVIDAMRLVNLNADIRVAGDLDLRIPPLHQGKRDIIDVDASETLDLYMDDIVKRTESLSGVDPRDDNILKIMTDARKAAIHLGLVEYDQPEPSKIGAAASKIADIYHELAAEALYDPHTGADDPVPGRLQVVFCDQGVPGGMAAHNVYGSLIEGLVDRGVPESMIEVIHDHKDGDEKLRLFKRCNSGEVAVLIGSTEKMGTGVNVQRRLAALHHIDAPWRPADIEQREGRALRSGNLSGSVRVIRYVTTGSFDTYSWQTLETKQRFITQMLSGRGDDTGLVPGDDSELEMDYNTVKAIATGDPRILERERLTQTYQKLLRQRDAHDKDQWRLRHVVRSAESDIPHNEARIAALRDVPDAPAAGNGVVFDGRHYPRLMDADEALRSKVGSIDELVRPWLSGERATEPVEVGHFAGAALHAKVDDAGRITFWRHSPDSGLYVRRDNGHWRMKDLAADLLRSARSRDDAIERLRSANERLEQSLASAQPLLGRPWRHQREMAEVKAEIDAIDEALNTEAKQHSQEQAPSDGPAAEPAANVVGNGHPQHHPHHGVPTGAEQGSAEADLSPNGSGPEPAGVELPDDDFAVSL